MDSVREQVRRLWADGMPANEIARRIGVAGPTVSYHLDRLERPAPAVERPAIQPDETARGGVSTRKQVADLLAIGLSRAEIARRLDIAKSTVAYHARGLGAPVDERCARRYDWSQVQLFYDEGHTVRECQLRFGFSRETWHAAVRRGAVSARPAGMPLAELLVSGTYRARHNLKSRLLREGVKEARCERCDLTAWLDAPVPLALHHVNGDRLDNRLENLELLCMNCHAQTPNFAGRRRRAA